MKWKDYRAEYSNFLLSLQRTEMTIFHAGKAIPRTPTKATLDDKREIPFFVNLARSGLVEFSMGYSTDRQLLDMESIVHIVFDGQTDRVLACQELTMIIAHLEVFIADTLIAVWHTNPELLERTAVGRTELKKRCISTFSSLTDKDFTELTERVIWDLMRKSSDAYLRYLQHELGLQVETDSRLLYRAGLNRHAIVHGGGLISQKYIDLLNDREKKGLRVGEPVPVDPDYVCEVYNVIQCLGEQIFEEVSKRYFGIEHPLEEHERVSKRQSPSLRENPLIDVAAQAIANMGGWEKAVAEWDRTKDEMLRLLDEISGKS